MALALRNQPDQGNTPVPDAVKFQVVILSQVSAGPCLSIVFV